MQETSEGILLHSIPYLGTKWILKVYTQTAGLISLISKKTSLSPFCVAEWVYEKKQSDLFRLKEGSLIDDLSALRQSYSYLSSAGQIVQCLLKTQMAEKPAPSLYRLAVAYLKKLPVMPFPETLVESFRIKLLLHEGLLSLQPQCIHCGMEARCLDQGASTCFSHEKASVIEFSLDEWQNLLLLAYTRKFSILEQIECNQVFTKKIKTLYEERISTTLGNK